MNVNRSLLFLLTLLLPSAVTVSAQSGQSSNSTDLPAQLGISFPADSQSTVLLTQNGKQYRIDVAAKRVEEVNGPVPASASNAQALFAQHCAGCHGADGKGLKSVGTPDFTNQSYAKSSSTSEIRHAIESGKDGRMPAWSGRLSGAEIGALVSYVQALPAGAQGPASSTQSNATNTAENKPSTTIYTPGDDVLVNLPTGRPTDKGGVYINFAHRFPFDPAFTGTGRGEQLLGLDGVAIPSLGVRYGVTDRLSLEIYRSPSLVGRPIELMAGYNILEEQKGNPLNLMVRVSVDGQNNFRKNYTENIEGILSRSITSKAQFYLVPTLSLNNRPLVQPVGGYRSDDILDLPGVNTFALGIGLAYDVRPTVALLAEVIPTLMNASELGIHRPAFSFGIQKKIWRHAFTLSLTNSPGTDVSQRAGTRAFFLGDPSADTFGGLGFGFNITRQIH